LPTVKRPFCACEWGFAGTYFFSKGLLPSGGGRSAVFQPRSTVVKGIGSIAVMLFALWAGSGAAAAQDINDLPWQLGPTVGKIGSQATITVPEGFAFLDAAGTRQLNEMMENPSGGDEYALSPVDMDWVAYFNFDDIGYVKDDETIDADEVLQSIRLGADQGNEERRKRGWETFHVSGWQFAPQYDQQLKALEWAVLARSQPSNTPVVNYNTRLLGRRGVMEVVVATEPDKLTASVAEFKRLVPGYSFASGHKYSEFVAGDHVAEMGLAALITGGAAVLATKKGWFAALGLALVKGWKLLLAGVVGLGYVVRRFFGGKEHK
jgi:uncharacterized membrane-anchored protein